jgi:putative ABC transport system substrate-binding protein
MKIERRVGQGSRKKGTIFSLASCTLLFALNISAHGQQAGKIARIGFLDTSTASESSLRLKAFWQEIDRLGWIQGKNLTVEYRFAEQDSKRIPELVADLVHRKFDLIAVVGTAAALAVKTATSTTPIVLTGVGDPVAAGLITSLARPEGNVTGVSTLAPDLESKRLEVLKDVIPKLSRVAVIRPPENSVAQRLQLEKLRVAAVSLSLKLEEIETRYEPGGLARAFQTAKEKQVGAVMTTAGPRMFNERKQIVGLADKYRMPAIYFQKEFIEEGGLMSYGVDYNDLYRRAAVYVDKILKGATPADLPVEQATKFEFIINLKTAKQIGLDIPPNVLARADRVIR